MAIEGDRYAPGLTSKSQTELQKFAKWYNTNQGGNWPTVIGGWAVWSYHEEGFGSRDVDLIFPTDEWIENMMIETYFPGNRFKKYRIGDPIFGELHYGKPIDGKDDVVFFDLVSAQTPREDTVNMGVTVDWNWVYEDQRARSIGNDASINVPSLEFLITLKIIGCISRRRQLQRAADESYFQSKIWKDCYDIANLASHLTPNGEKLLYHFNRTGLNRELFQEFLEIYDGKKNALEDGKAKMEYLERLLGLFGQ